MQNRAAYALNSRAQNDGIVFAAFALARSAFFDGDAPRHLPDEVQMVPPPGSSSRATILPSLTMPTPVEPPPTSTMAPSRTFQQGLRGAHFIDQGSAGDLRAVLRT